MDEYDRLLPVVLPVVFPVAAGVEVLLVVLPSCCVVLPVAAGVEVLPVVVEDCNAVQSLATVVLPLVMNERGTYDVVMPPVTVSFPLSVCRPHMMAYVIVGVSPRLFFLFGMMYSSAYFFSLS